jgi:hypothetical protein
VDSSRPARRNMCRHASSITESNTCSHGFTRGRRNSGGLARRAGPWRRDSRRAWARGGVIRAGCGPRGGVIRAGRGPGAAWSRSCGRATMIVVDYPRYMTKIHHDHEFENGPNARPRGPGSSAAPLAGAGGGASGRGLEWAPQFRSASRSEYDVEAVILAPPPG